MPGNEFEKQVQQKMNELHFVPSAAVWQEVEKQINERKKRRLPFLWLMLLCVLLGGAAWIFMPAQYKKTTVKNGREAYPLERVKQLPEKENSDQHSGNAAANTIRTVTPLSGLADPHPNAKAPGNPSGAGRQKENSQLAVDKTNAATAPALRPQAASHSAANRNVYGDNLATSRNKHRPSAARMLNGNNMVNSSHKRNQYKAAETKPLATEESSPTLPMTTEENHPHTEQVTAADAGKSQPINAVDSSLAVTASPEAVPAVADSAADSPGAPVKNKKPSKPAIKMRWGFYAGAGVPNVSQGLAGVFSASRTYDAALYSTGSQSNTPGTANNGVGSSPRPSGLTPGFSYAAGVFVTIPLGKNIRLNTGMGYHYYSTHLQVGSKIDSNKALLQFRNDNAAAGSSVGYNYTNRFHFIELPVTIDRQFGKNSRFSANAGLALSVLLGSNALQYDAQRNIYYANNSVINKTQLGLLAGLRYRFFQKTFMADAGPQLNYGLGNIFTKELYGSRHLFFAGLGLRIILNTKKQ